MNFCRSLTAMSPPITGASPSLLSCLVHTQQPVDPAEVKDRAVSPWTELLNSGSRSLAGWSGLPRAPQTPSSHGAQPSSRHSPPPGEHPLLSAPCLPQALSSVTPVAASLTIFRCFSVSFSMKPMVFPLLERGSTHHHLPAAPQLGHILQKQVHLWLLLKKIFIGI